MHYVLVTDDSMSEFSRFGGSHRIVLPGAQFLPNWLRLAPRLMQRNGRRVWWSFRSPPVNGWHVQQIVKIAAASQFPEDRYCIVDSDNVFFRQFKADRYAGRDLSPLYVDRAAIFANSPLHAHWTRNCDRLLGLPPTPFPADDYIGQAIVWDRRSARGMTQAIESVAGHGWVEALCRTRAFSEYLLYGHFVRNSPAHFATHHLVTESLASAYWEQTPLNAESIASMVDKSTRKNVALSIASISHTPVPTIRSALKAIPAAPI
jgi:hypothetical protein